MKLKITVHGVAYEVDVEVLDDDQQVYPSALPHMPHIPDPHPSGGSPLPPRPKMPKPSLSAGGAVTSPIAGIVLEVKCAKGDSVSEGDILMIVEAMKMKTSIAAPTSGNIKNIPVSKGDNIREGETLIEFE